MTATPSPLIKVTRKGHDRFKTGPLRGLFRSVPDEKLEGTHITSPFHYYEVERLRDRHKLGIGEPVPTDLFLWAKGEPKKREVTKIGGLPYWPKARPWPQTASGEPYRFVAQFNFGDSQDLLPKLPGDLLLVFAADFEMSLDDPEQAHFEWLNLTDEPLIAKRSIPAVEDPLGSFWGAIHRTHDYPAACTRWEELEVRSGYNLPIFNGTKIGGTPHFVQKPPSVEGTFLCQLASVQAAPAQDYPWVNRKGKLNTSSGPRGISAEANEVMFGDMGSHYLYLTRAGEILVMGQCY